MLVQREPNRSKLPLENSNSYSNFANSINSEQTRRIYEYSLTRFLKHHEMDLDSFLKLSQQGTSNLIINYLVKRIISKQYKTIVFSAIKHACVMNDVILNWPKLKNLSNQKRQTMR